MKLLFDQNISFRIVNKLDDRFKDCKQVRQVGLEDSEDTNIWKYAQQHGFTIVTFDSDFYDISLIHSHPPKIVWLRGGNMPTSSIVRLLNSFYEVIEDFVENAEEACLEIM